MLDMPEGACGSRVSLVGEALLSQGHLTLQGGQLAGLAVDGRCQGCAVCRGSRRHLHAQVHAQAAVLPLELGWPRCPWSSSRAAARGAAPTCPSQAAPEGQAVDRSHQHHHVCVRSFVVTSRQGCWSPLTLALKTCPFAVVQLKFQQSQARLPFQGRLGTAWAISGCCLPTCLAAQAGMPPDCRSVADT